MFGLSFLYPLFLIGAVAVAIPVVLHLFRRRTELVVDFPAVQLLQKTPFEQQRRRKLRELILLALRVAALLLLAFAFARPYFKGAVAAMGAPITVVALDTSMSLTAPGQFEAARAAARKAVQAAPVTELVGLVTFSDTASVVVPPTPDRGGVLAAIDQVKPGPGGTRFRTALALAGETVAASGGRIVVVSDLQQSGWEASDEGGVPDGVEVEVMEVRPPEGNLAVTALRREGDAIIAAVHNFGSRPAKVAAHLKVEGRELASTIVQIQPQSAAEARLVGALPARGGLEVTIDDPTGYAADNARYLVLDPAGAAPVVVITADAPGSSSAGLYIERALSVAEDGRTFHVRVLEGPKFSSLTTQDLGQPAALVVLGTRTLDRKGRETIAGYVKDGGRVLLSLGPDIDLETLNDVCGTNLGVDRESAKTTGQVTLIPVDVRHPIFRPFLSASGALGDVYFDVYRRLSDQGDRTVLARFSGGSPALTEQSIGKGRLLIFASDLDNQWNRFPLNPSFVPFAVETLRYLTQGSELRQSWTLPDVPRGLAASPGIYSVGRADVGNAASSRRVAINVDIRESNPARTTIEEFTGAITRLNRTQEARAVAEAKEDEERQRLWQIGLVAMILALAGEGFVGRKVV